MSINDRVPINIPNPTVVAVTSRMVLTCLENLSGRSLEGGRVVKLVLGQGNVVVAFSDYCKNPDEAYGVLVHAVDPWEKAWVCTEGAALVSMGFGS